VDVPLQRALASLEGLALGDAFGESFFGHDAEQRVARRQLGPGPWKWTDDTAMAISIVETLAVHDTVDQDDLARRFADRHRLEPARGYGAATHQVLGAISSGIPWAWAARGQFGGRGSCGNGAAMRAPVVGAWFADDMERTVAEARRAAEVTHAHPEGMAGAVAVAVAAALAASGDAWPTGRSFLEAVLERVPPGQVSDGIGCALALGYGLPVAEVARVLGNGGALTAQDTVPFVLWCASQHINQYEEALWVTVGGLGDRDTTCAMVGGIVACHVGRPGLPQVWLAQREPLPPLRVPAASRTRPVPGGQI
jgi:ADP-ribosylglycohydrolase